MTKVPIIFLLACSPDGFVKLLNSLIAPAHPLLQDVSSKLIQINIAVPIWIHPASMKISFFEEVETWLLISLFGATIQ